MYLGIDFGEKKVGAALSDMGGAIAFPHEVWENNEQLIARIKSIVAEKKIAVIVVGDTRTAAGEENAVTPLFERFVRTLSVAVSIPVKQVGEAGTSGVARAGLGEGEVRGVVQSARALEDGVHDARAAAVILQRYLDVHRGA